MSITLADSRSSITFTFVNETSLVSVTAVTATIHAGLLEDSAEDIAESLDDDDDDVFSAPIGQSYKCSSELLELGSISLTLSELQVQAFRNAGEDFGDAVLCSGDQGSTRSNLVPVVVGVVVGVVILVVVVVFFIKRSREHEGPTL